MQATQEAELFTEVILEVFKLQGLLNSEGDALTQEYGLSSARWKILGAIEVRSEALTVPQIARTMGQSRQAVQKVVTAMHKDGFLSLIENPNHKRAKLIELTTKGKKAYESLKMKQIPWANKHSEHLNATELKMTLNILKSISNSFELK